MATFNDIINKCKKDWKCPTLMDGALAKRGPKIKFSSPMMNYATYGGIPRKRIIHFYGNPSCGKSCTAVDLCKNAYAIFEKEYNDEIISLQEQSIKDKSLIGVLDELKERGVKKILYLDLEHAFDGEWAKVLGIDPDCIQVMQPPNVFAEEILSVVEDLIETGEVGMVVLDSIPSLVTKKEMEKEYGEATVASAAGLLTLFMRRIVPILDRYDCTLILINQIRDNLTNPYVSNTPGGRAIKFYSSLMIEFQVGTPVDFLGNELPQKTDNPAGYKITAKITKQKSAPFNRKNASYFLMTDSGIRTDMDFAQVALTKYEIIKKSGSWFILADPYTGEILEGENGKPFKLHGMANVYEYLQNNPDYYKKLEKFILDDLLGTDSQEEYIEDVVSDSEDGLEEQEILEEVLGDKKLAAKVLSDDKKGSK